LAYPRRKIDGADEECQRARKRMGNEECSVGDDLQTVSVVHRVIGGEKNFRRNEDKERSNTKKDPKNRFKSGTSRAGRE
jgi:hypothetical protein